MKAAQKKLIECLKAERVAMCATRDAANDAMDADRFNAACARLHDIEEEIRLAYRGKFTGCSISRELAAANID